MTIHIGRGSTEKKVNAVRMGAKLVQQKPYAGRWNTPGVDTNPPVPPLAANFIQPSDATIEKFKYRLHMDGSPEFTGHVELDGATSPALVITLPAGNQVGYEAQPSYRIGTKKQYYPTVVIDTNGSTAVPAVMEYNPVNGQLKLIWPL